MIALGADHGGFALKEEIKKHLDDIGVAYQDFGTYSPESVDYAKIAYKTCQAVVSGECEKKGSALPAARIISARSLPACTTTPTPFAWAAVCSAPDWLLKWWTSF